MASSATNTSVVQLDVHRVTPIAEAPPSTPLDALTSIQSGAQVESTSQLEPADRGAAAWRLICVAFVFEALLWGEGKLVIMRAGSKLLAILRIGN